MVKMVRIEIPEDLELLKAIGRVSASHAQLELMLKYCVKTLGKMEVRVALDATQYMKMFELRERIKKLFKENATGETYKTKLDALLTRANRLSERRNNLIHRPWKRADRGLYEVKADDHGWTPSPTCDQLNQLADEILALSVEINHERLRGFIAKAMNKKKKR